MPAVPAIIAVAGAVISAKVASDANKRSIQANKETTTQAIDYQKQENEAKRARYDAYVKDYKAQQSAYYKHFYGFDPNEGQAQAAAPAKPTPVTTGGTYAPGFGPAPTAPQVTTPNRAPVMPPGGVQQQGTYLQQPAGGKQELNGYMQPPQMDINAIVGAGGKPGSQSWDPKRYFNTPIASIQPWSFNGPSSEPPAPTGPGLPGQQPMEWNDWAKYGVGSPMGR